MIKDSNEDDLEHRIQEFYNELVILLKFEGLSDDEMSTLYTLGYNLFMYGKYKDAKKIFFNLVAFAPYTAEYWRALGATDQRLREYGEAISSYNMAIANDPTDVVNYAYRGEFRMLYGKLEEGLEDLKKVIEIGEGNPEFKLWVERSKFLLKIHGVTE